MNGEPSSDRGDVIARAVWHNAALAPLRAHLGGRRGGARRRERVLPRLCAEDGWFSLHAGVRIPAHDRIGLERLCGFVARPPLSHERLTRRDDGLLELRLKSPWKLLAVLHLPTELPRAHRARDGPEEEEDPTFWA